MPTSLAQPYWLFALAIPAALAIYALRAGRRPVPLPLDGARCGEGRVLGGLLRAAAILPALLLAIAIVLLAGPQRAGAPGREREMTNIEFLVDVSGSMTQALGDGTRFDGSIAAIEAFTSHRTGDAFGLTIFGDEVLHWTPLTRDIAAIRAAPPFLRPETMPPQFGGTEIGKAVRASMRRIASRGEGGVMVLVSDGQSSDLGGSTARQIGGELAAAGIVLYAIHVGDEEVPTDLFDLARPGGGEVFPARDLSGLSAVFRRIDELQPARVKPTAARPVEAPELPSLLGLVVLGMYQATLFGLRMTPW